jgi:hypothetical protein
MIMQPTDLDPSLAFTALLDQGALAGLTSDDGANMRAELLRAYYAQEEVRNLWDFTRAWLIRRRGRVDRLSARRIHHHSHVTNPRRDYCTRDNEDWPCTVIRLLDELDEVTSDAPVPHP